MFNDGHKFKNRYRLCGTLVALSPVHVGDGENDSTIAGRNSEMGAADTTAKYNTFVIGHNGLARIPGSTLKGVVRAWLTERVTPETEPLVRELFGRLEIGGKVTFHDAPLVAKAPGKNKDRWWDEKRGTCLAPGASLKASTRTADEGLLYHTEYAPEGSEFGVTVTAEYLTEAELALLCAAFAEGFGMGENGVRVGAETADGWGRMEWRKAKLEVITPEAVKTWLDSGAKDSHTSLYKECPISASSVPKGVGREMVLEVSLRFDGALLVNDPSQFRKMAQGGVGHAMVRRRNGQFFLPASSVRGALRAQTRKIWQTLADGKDGDQNQRSVTEAKEKRGQESLHALDKMWGAPGWRSPITVPDFELVNEMTTRRQEFVAVDRFTGGAADEKKFSADALYGPEFRGILRVDLAAWDRAKTGQWAFLLLAFLLRDLREGDVRFGFGSSKGYGACTAEIVLRDGGGNGDLLRGVVGRDSGALGDPQLSLWEKELLAELEKAA